MSDNRPSRYEEDGKVVYRASSLMMCDRMFIALAEFYTPQAHPAWFQEVLDEGTNAEQSIIDMYESKYDRIVSGGQQEVELEVLDGVFIRGHTDGKTQDNTLFEAKKFRESTWGKFMRNGVEAMPWYPWQVSAYMHGLGMEECDFVGGLFKDGQIVDVEVKHLSMPPIPMKGLIKRVAHLEALVNKGKRVDDVPCNVQMYPCPFFYLHDADDSAVPPTRPSDETLVALVSEREELKAKAKALTGEAKGIESRVKELNQGVNAWLTAANVEDDEVVRVDVEGTEFDLKYHTVYNKGYTVEPFDYTLVTVKPKKAKLAPKPRAKR